MHIFICIIMFMKLICDPAKNQKNIETRALPLLAAEAMFNDAMLVIEDPRKPYPERRLSVTTRWMAACWWRFFAMLRMM